MLRSRAVKPKDTAALAWTNHVVGKMAYYRLSPARVRRVLASPARCEEGVAPGTLALMQPEGREGKRTEIWVMVQKVGKRKRVITAWRYPGTSPVRSAVPIPDDVRAALEEAFPAIRRRANTVLAA